ncbi:MAG: glycerol-3-phosphate dehydrogenase, partial [Varibaculum cambriense]|nr:glycerol-3-phosphate dehydrogenase [Varibaculum cambriense]
MSVITVLGAGAMGSALCTPVADAGWEVRLWGTWLDDHLLDAVE